jgi:hypothetical protein
LAHVGDDALHPHRRGLAHVGEGDYRVVARGQPARRLAPALA